MIGIMKALAFTGGDWVIYILIVCSVLTVAIIIEKSILLSRERKAVLEVKKVFEDGIALGQMDSLAGKLSVFSVLPARVIAEGMSKKDQGVDVVEETMTAVANLERRRLETRMIVINTLGNNAVYIGLFGTVLGVIKAFRDLSLAGGGGAEVVMQGLSEALIATAAGLMVAIPCVVAYNIFQKQIREILTDSEAMSRFLLARLKTDAKR